MLLSRFSGLSSPQVSQEICAPEEEEEVLSIDEREKQYLAALADFTEKAEQFKFDQANMNERRISMDKRSFAILAFESTIHIWGQRIDLRGDYARQSLATPIDDLGLEEEAVKILETSNSVLEKNFRPDTNPDIEAQIHVEEMNIQNILSKNAAREAAINFRRMQFEASKYQQAKPLNDQEQKKPEIIQETTIQPTSEIDKRPIDISEEQERSMIDKIATLRSSQLKISSIEREVAQSEKNLHDFQRNNQNLYNQKSSQIALLRVSLRQIDSLKLQVAQMCDENDRLRADIQRNDENMCEPRRIRANLDQLQEFSKMDSAEISGLQAKINERKTYSEVKQRHINRHKKSAKALHKEVAEMQTKVKQIEDSVNQLDAEIFKCELQLNDALRESQTYMLDIYNQSTFESSCTPTSQYSEVQKILSLISESRKEQIVF